MMSSKNVSVVHLTVEDQILSSGLVVSQIAVRWNHCASIRREHDKPMRPCLKTRPRFCSTIVSARGLLFGVQEIGIFASRQKHHPEFHDQTHSGGLSSIIRVERYPHILANSYFRISQNQLHFCPFGFSRGHGLIDRGNCRPVSIIFDGLALQQHISRNLRPQARLVGCILRGLGRVISRRHSLTSKVGLNTSRNDPEQGESRQHPRQIAIGLSNLDLIFRNRELPFLVGIFGCLLSFPFFPFLAGGGLQKRNISFAWETFLFFMTGIACQFFTYLLVGVWQRRPARFSNENTMPEDKTDQDKFDAILRRLINNKPQTGEETKARAKTERAAKKLVKPHKRKVSG